MSAKFLSCGTATLDTAADVPLSASRINTRKIIIQAADSADLITIKDANGTAIGEVRNGESFTIEISRTADRGGHHLNCQDYSLRATTANKTVYTMREALA